MCVRRVNISLAFVRIVVISSVCDFTEYLAPSTNKWCLVEKSIGKLYYLPTTSNNLLISVPDTDADFCTHISICVPSMKNLTVYHSSYNMRRPEYKYVLNFSAKIALWYPLALWQYMMWSSLHIPMNFFWNLESKLVTIICARLYFY